MTSALLHPVSVCQAEAFRGPPSISTAMTGLTAGLNVCCGHGSGYPSIRKPRQGILRNLRSVWARETLSQVKANTTCAGPLAYVRVCFNDVKQLYKQKGGLLPVLSWLLQGFGRMLPFIWYYSHVIRLLLGH